MKCGCADNHTGRNELLQVNKKTIRFLLFIAYGVFIVWYAILSRNSTGIHHADLRFMWSYRELFAGDLNGKKDVIQNIDNILFFLPFGFLAPFKNWKIVLIVAVVFSVIIELIQYIGGFGLAELDDVICNTIGAVLGFLSWIGIKKLVRRLHET